MRAGSDVTLVGFSKMVGYCLKAAELLEAEGISAEVLNLRTLKPIDREAIAASVRKTHRLVSVEEGWPQHGVGAGAGTLMGRLEGGSKGRLEGGRGLLAQHSAA